MTELIKRIFLGVVACIIYSTATAANPPLLLEYTFNERGAYAKSSGLLDVPLEFRSRSGNQLIELRSANATGVSGKSGDRAFDNTDAEMGGAGGVAKTAANVDGIDGLTSFTYCGWYKTKDASFVGSNARLGKDFDENKGWQFLGNNSDGVLFYADAGSRSISGKSVDLSILAQTGEWVFFAITYDGSKTSNNLKLYAGDKKTAVTLITQQTVNSGALDANTTALTVGNEANRSRAFAGYIDNLRLYGTKASRDSSGVLTLEQLETLRADDVSGGSAKPAAAPAAANANEDTVVYDKATKMYTDTRFPEYLFPYRPTLIFNCYAEGYQFVREPVLRRMPDGSLFCMHYTGGPSEPNDNNLMLATTSQDDGKTWTESRILFDHTVRGVYAPELFTEGGVPTVFLHTFSEISRYAEMRPYLSRSYDSGKTWSEPIAVPGVPGCMLIRKAIKLVDGTHLLPHYWTEQTGNNNWDWEERNPRYYNRPSMRNWMERCGVLRSTDNGETYTHYGYIRAEDPKVRLLEPECIELEPNHILMLIRSDGKGAIYKSESFDGGMTWSVAEPSGIPAVAAKVILLRYKDAVVMMFNAMPESTTGDGLLTRQRLSAWVSLDNCKTWTTKVDLARVKPDVEEKWKAVCYPEGFIDEGKKMLYCALDTYRQAFLIKVPLADLGLN